jgi:hypothetical protein
MLGRSLASARVKIGVMFDLSGEPRELLADARALEAAGADSFWVAPDVDQLIVLAALAAVTWRPRLIAVAVAVGGALSALEHLAKGRLFQASPRGAELAVAAGDGEAERWLRVEMPVSKAAWREVRAAREAEGVSGLVLPNDPRLLDLLRNPDVEDDRPDLKLAFG